MELEIKQLPTTALMLENAAFLMQEDYVNAWPLICDPTSRVLDWLYHYKHDKGLVVVRYSVSYVNIKQLWSDVNWKYIQMNCDMNAFQNVSYS